MRLRAFNLIPGLVISEPERSHPADRAARNEYLVVQRVERSDEDECVIAYLLARGEDKPRLRVFHFCSDVEVIGTSVNLDPEDTDYGTEDERSFEPQPIEDARLPLPLPRRVPGMTLDVTIGRAQRRVG